MNMLRYLLWILCALAGSVQSKPELKMLHVVFAHKLYAPLQDVSRNNGSEIPRNLTYEYFNYATIDIPNTGKLNMYNLGTYLRKTYDKFLGDFYTKDVTKMRTAEYPMSILSAQLVNAGLWPPNNQQKWHETLNWQPLPADYLKLREDTLLMGTHCPSFQIELKNVLKVTGMSELPKQYSPLFAYLSNNTGIKIEQISDVALLYATLETKADLNQTLPNWAKDIFPHGAMYNVSMLLYDTLSESQLQKQLNGGTMLKEIAGNLLRYIQGVIPHSRKIMLYSGNDRNVAGLLKSMDTWSPHIPNEAAAVIFEMYHDNVTNTHYVKIKYYTGTDGDTIPLKIRNCTEMCSLKTFLNAYFDLMPESEQLLCNWRVPSYYNMTMRPEMKYINNSALCAPMNLLTIMLLMITLSFSNWR